MSDFREKYRRDNDLLRAPRKMPEEVMNMTNGNDKEKNTGTQNKRAVRIIAASIAACLVVAVLAAIPMLNRGRDLPLIETVSVGDLHAAEDYSQLYKAIKDLRRDENGLFGGFGVLTDGAVMEEAVEEEVVLEDAPEAPMTAPTTSVPTYNAAADTATGSAGKDYSTTNTQKENVDEADIIKTDGSYIYRLSGGALYILDPVKMTTVTCIEPAEEHTPENGWFWVNDMYISGDRLVLMYSREVPREDSDWRTDTFSGALVYDITDRTAPALLGDCAQSGHLNSSRLIGDYVYMVTAYGVYNEIDKDKPETFVPCLYADGQLTPMSAADVCLLPDPATSTYAVITSVNITNGSEFGSTQATFGNGSTVYADTERIILACSLSENTEEDTQEGGRNVTVRSYTQKTKLISYTISGGSVTLTATGEVPGSLLNQFALDRHNGVLRVVTTTSSSTEKIFTDGIDSYEWESFSANGLYVLDDGMNIIGTLDGLAEDERVYSVRFSGDIGYFVTFRQVDPLFAVDLSDPTNPTLLSALKIPGFSQYMHPYADGLMLGLGMDADEETGATKGMKLSMFDISDPANVTEKHKLLLGREISYSEALHNHKAALINAGKDVIAFPTWNGYLVYGYSDDTGFYERYVLEIEPGKMVGTLRSLYIGDSFYICSDYSLLRYDITDFAPTGELTFAQPGEDIVYAEEPIYFDTDEEFEVDAPVEFSTTTQAPDVIFAVTEPELIED